MLEQKDAQTGAPCRVRWPLCWVLPQLLACSDAEPSQRENFRRFLDTRAAPRVTTVDDAVSGPIPTIVHEALRAGAMFDPRGDLQRGCDVSLRRVQFVRYDPTM
jgi:hypothetical protein